MEGNISVFSLEELTRAVSEASVQPSGVNFSGQARKLDTEDDAKPIVEAIAECKQLDFLNLTGNTLGVDAAKAIAVALKSKPEFKTARWSDIFTGRMKTEIPKALCALGDGMILAGARLTLLDLSDNAFGPIGVEGLASLIVSSVCDDLQELRLNNNGLGITGGNLLAKALLRHGKSEVPRLKIFVAGRNRLENDGATALAQVFKAMGSLEEVSMPQNGIYHAGVAALADAFKANRGLRVLNLNDNTIGEKGADAISEALPQLRSLREVNFGDCLLESAGAVKLAAAVASSGVSLECLDLSHNEIGGSACVFVASALASSPPGVLRRVSLAGNTVGTPANRRKIKSLLGEAVVLRDDDEESEDDDEEDNENEAEERSDEGNSTGNSSTNRNDSTSSAASPCQNAARNGDPVLSVFNFGVPQPILDLTADDSVTVVDTPASTFLAEPTLENFLALGSGASATLEDHLKAIKDQAESVEAHVSAIMKVSSLVDAASIGAAEAEQCRLTAIELYRSVTGRGGYGTRWILGNSVLVSLGLIKSETKCPPVKYNQSGCLSVLSSVINEKWFPDSLRDTVKFFIKNKMDTGKDGGAALIDYSRYPGLC